MDPHYLDVENLNFGIDECEEFNPFEYEENLTPTSNPQSVPSSNSEHVGKKPRVSKRTSLVWNHFTIINKENSKGEVENVAQCKYCKKIYSCKASDGTGHLRRHAEQCTKKHGALDPKQSQISQSGSSSMKPFMYNHERIRENFGKVVASMNLPLGFTQDPRVLDLMEDLQPSFKRIPKTTIRKDIIKNHKNKKQIIVEELTNYNGVLSVTSDIWTSCKDDPNACVTSHYIDSNWELHKKVLGFLLICHPHDVPNIYECITSVFKEYDIVNKIFSITFDNASNNTSAIDLFVKTIRTGPQKEMFHVRCVCHIFNLIVQDGLKLISPSIAAIRFSLKFICCGTSKIKQEFSDLCKSQGLKPKKFHRDVPHRWNSTYLMLKSCQTYENVISDFVNTKIGEIKISSNDWEIGLQFVHFLKVFYEATNMCSTVYTPTSCIALRYICNISDLFKKYRDNLLFFF